MCNSHALETRIDFFLIDGSDQKDAMRFESDVKKYLNEVMKRLVNPTSRHISTIENAVSLRDEFISGFEECIRTDEEFEWFTQRYGERLLISPEALQVEPTSEDYAGLAKKVHREIKESGYMAGVHHVVLTLEALYEIREFIQLNIFDELVVKNNIWHLGELMRKLNQYSEELLSIGNKLGSPGYSKVRDRSYLHREHTENDEQDNFPYMLAEPAKSALSFFYDTLFRKELGGEGKKLSKICREEGHIGLLILMGEYKNFAETYTPESKQEEKAAA
ncbi:hypothetical protein JXC34_05445 [Candidatus Woesearchaeota archaeon]|nr:hypothetical protein [Candidatus Woesearchaeota archaeon]